MNYYYKLSCKYDRVKGMGKCAWEYSDKIFKTVDQTSKPPQMKC